ncbi:MAG: EutN/CcmL family microcompartment protein [Planctomycetota bacterium]
MQPARVLGRTHCTIKHESLRTHRLVIAQPVGVNDVDDGAPLIVLDPVGCGPGDRVILTSDAKALMAITRTKTCPARWSVMGLID